MKRPESDSKWPETDLKIAKNDLIIAQNSQGIGYKCGENTYFLR